MPWTQEEKIEALLRLPWTVKTARTEDGFVAEVAELPSALATGDTMKLLARDLWDSLKATLTSYLEFNDPIPLPAGVSAPWEASESPAPRTVAVRRATGSLGGEGWQKATLVSTASSSRSEILIPA